MQKYSEKLKKLGCDLIIAITHMRIAEDRDLAIKN